MSIAKIALFAPKTKKRASLTIQIHSFVDLYYDTIGWYALGHHDAQTFLATVAQKDPATHFSTKEVLLTWAICQNNEIEITDSFVQGSQPITLVEDWGECNCEECWE
jgi:hypothetical protein